MLNSAFASFLQGDEDEDAYSAPVEQEISMVKAQDMSCTQQIIDMVMAGLSVIVNLSQMKTEEKQRTIDILYGASYAMEGNINSISLDNYMFCPGEVHFEDEQEE